MDGRNADPFNRNQSLVLVLHNDEVRVLHDLAWHMWLRGYDIEVLRRNRLWSVRTIGQLVDLVGVLINEELLWQLCVLLDTTADRIKHLCRMLHAASPVCVRTEPRLHVEHECSVPGGRGIRAGIKPNCAKGCCLAGLCGGSVRVRASNLGGLDAVCNVELNVIPSANCRPDWLDRQLHPPPGQGQVLPAAQVGPAPLALVQGTPLSAAVSDGAKIRVPLPEDGVADLSPLMFNDAPGANLPADRWVRLEAVLVDAHGDPVRNGYGNTVRILSEAFKIEEEEEEGLMPMPMPARADVLPPAPRSMGNYPVRPELTAPGSSSGMQQPVLANMSMQQPMMVLQLPMGAGGPVMMQGDTGQGQTLIMVQDANGNMTPMLILADMAGIAGQQQQHLLHMPQNMSLQPQGLVMTTGVDSGAGGGQMEGNEWRALSISELGNAARYNGAVQSSGKPGLPNSIAPTAATEQSLGMRSASDAGMEGGLLTPYEAAAPVGPV